jgi:hypothetical protein
MFDFAAQPQASKAQTYQDLREAAVAIVAGEPTRWPIWPIWRR